MRSHPQSALRQLLVPNGLLVMAGVGALVYALPATKYQQSLGLFCIGILAASALLAVRLHSLRAFLAMISLSAYVLFLRLGPADSSIRSCATALVAIDFALLLLVEDVFFDWQAILWWAGLLAVQWTAFAGVSQSAETMLRDITATHVQLPSGSFGPLEAVFAVSALLLLGKFLLAPDAVGAGVFWAMMPIAFALRQSSSANAYISLSGLAIGIAVIERSHWIAYHDELTGLPGRRAFNEAVAGLGGEYSVAIVDIDHFKKFNDTFGHETGDQVLRKVAAHLAKVRGGGSAYRCGGEEFAIIFPESGIEESIGHAENVRVSIEEDVFVARGPSRSTRERPERRASGAGGEQAAAVETAVTVSVGIADSRAGHDVQQIIQAADKALYKAKSLGRNRVERAIAKPARRTPAKTTIKKTPAPAPQQANPFR